jgi:hypothetical protein
VTAARTDHHSRRLDRLHLPQTAAATDRAPLRPRRQHHHHQRRRRRASQARSVSTR